MNNLLAEASGSDAMMLYIILGVAGGLLLLCAVYGAIRKFSRLTWIGWQLLIAFGLDIAISYLPLEGPQYFAVWLVLFIVIVALPLIAEFFLRRAVLTGRILPPRTGAKVLDHIFGALTAIVGFLMFFASIGAVVLAAGDAFMEAPLLNTPIWTDFLSKYALDFFLIAVFMVTMRAGCRLGVFKLFYYILILLLVFGAFFGSLLLFSQVDWGLSFSTMVGGWFGLEGSLASIVGCGTVTLVSSLILFVLIMFLSRLIDWSIQRVNSNRIVGAVDALLMGAVFSAVFLGIVLGVQAVFGALAQGNFLQGLLGGDLASSLGDFASTLTGVAESFVKFARSAPISRGLYDGNFLLSLLP